MVFGGLALAALFLPVRSGSQALFAASAGLALLTFWLWGQLFGRRVLGIPRLGSWTAVYLGQFAVLAATAPILALNGVMGALLGASLPLVALLVPPTLALAVVHLRTPRETGRLDLLPLIGLGCVAVVISIYSAHLSALGLDLHEHVAWIRQIVKGGHVPLEEPGSGIVGDYPRSFHALAALWTAAGLSPPAGPFAKAMPFLQTALPALAFGEQMIAAHVRDSAEPRWRWEAAVGLAFYVYCFLLVPAVYPGPDLLGTPRYSSVGLLLLPVVLVVIARAQQAPAAAWDALWSVPLVAAWGVAWNPVVAVAVVAATMPVLAIFWAALRPGLAAQRRRRSIAGFAVSCALAVVVLASDPWVVSTAAQRLPAAGAAIHLGGLMTFDEGVARGVATPREKSVRNAAPAPACRDAGCVARHIGEAALDALSVPWSALRSAGADLKAVVTSPSLMLLRNAFRGAFPLRNPLIADFAPFPLFVWLAAAAVLAAAQAARRGPLASSGVARRWLATSLLALAISGIGLAFVTDLASALDDQTHESVILASYLGRTGLHVGLGLLWLPFCAATFVLLEPWLRRARPADPLPAGRAVAWSVAGVAVWTALSFAARLNLHLPIQHRGFYGPIGLSDLAALRHVEAIIPPADGVIVPAEHANIANWEHWVLPVGDTTALLPYGDRRYLFDVYLGASYPFSWRDLEDGLCGSDPVARSRFLERSRARWVLVRDTAAADAAGTIGKSHICGVPLAALGAELPAAREAHGIFLFRLNRSAPGSR